MKIGGLILVKLYSNGCTFSKTGLHDYIRNLACIRKTPTQYHLGAVEGPDEVY